MVKFYLNLKFSFLFIMSFLDQKFWKAKLTVYIYFNFYFTKNNCLKINIKLNLASKFKRKFICMYFWIISNTFSYKMNLVLKTLIFSTFFFHLCPILGRDQILCKYKSFDIASLFSFQCTKQFLTLNLKLLFLFISSANTKIQVLRI